MPYLVLLAFEDQVDAQRLVSEYGGASVVPFAVLPARLEVRQVCGEGIVAVIAESQGPNSAASARLLDCLLTLECDREVWRIRCTVHGVLLAEGVGGIPSIPEMVIRCPGGDQARS